MSAQISQQLFEHKPHQAARAAPTLRPMGLWLSLLYFGLPALLMRLSLYHFLPWLVRAGLNQFEAAAVALTAPTAVLFALPFGLYQAEGRPVTWRGLAERFRLRRLTRRDWLWTAAGFLLAFLGTGALGATSLLLIRTLPAITPPAWFPAFLNPQVTANISTLPAALEAAAGSPLHGNWGIILLLFIPLFFNVFGEELWWRGYILPRQELAHGRWTWILHAGLWLLFHMPVYPWRLLDLLPYCLVISFVAQRTKNTWPGIIIHWQNGMVLLAVIAMVFGWL